MTKGKYGGHRLGFGYKSQSKFRFMKPADMVPVWSLPADLYSWIEGPLQDLVEIAHKDLPGIVRLGEWIDLERHGVRRVSLILVRYERVFLALSKLDDIVTDEDLGVGEEEAAPQQQGLDEDPPWADPGTGGADSQAVGFAAVATAGA